MRARNLASFTKASEASDRVPDTEKVLSNVLIHVPAKFKTNFSKAVQPIA